MKTRYLISLLMAALLAHGLAGCGGAEERKTEYLNRGKKFFEESNYDKARVEFKNALQIDPKAAQPYFYLGLIEESKQSWQEAFNLFSKAAELGPEDLQVKVKLAKFYMMGNSPDKAEEFLNTVLQKQPKDIEARILKAALDNSKGNQDAAVQQLTSVIADEPKRIDTYLALGVIYEQKKDPAAVERLLQQGLAANPGNSALTLALAKFSAQQKQPEKAEGLVKQLIESEPDNLDYRNLLAQLYIQSKRFDEAEKVLRQAIERDPKDVRRYGLLTEFLIKSGKSDLAVEELTKAIESFPKEAGLRFALGQTHELLKQPVKAESVYNAIIEQIETKPEQLKAKDRLAYLAAAQGKPEQANQLVEAVLKESPQDGQALMLQGRMALANKDAQKAIAAFRSMLKDQPDSVEVLTLLASAHHMDGKPALAQESLEKAALVNPNDFASRKRLIEFLGQQKNFAGAMDKIDDYLKLNPKNLEALNAKADILAVDKQFEALEKFLVQMRSDLPDQFSPSFRLGQLYRTQKKDAAALAEFEASLKKSGDNLLPLKEIVGTYIDMGQPEKGLARLKQAIAEKPKDAALYEMLAAYHAKLKHDDDAVKALKQAIEISPRWPVPYNSLASVYAQQGKFDLAIKTFEGALKVFPDNVELLQSLANLHERAKDIPGAIKRYEEILAKSPDSMVAINNLASLLSLDVHNQENLQKAKVLSQRLASAREPALMDTQAWISYQVGETGKALELMQKIVEKAPDEPIFNYHFGMMLLKNGDAVAAKTHLTKAVDSGKEFIGLEDAKEALKKL